MGKTLVSAGIVKAFIDAGVKTHYLKPFQTGEESDHDLSTVASLQDKENREKYLTGATLWSYPKPVSPHLAENIGVCREGFSGLLNTQLEDVEDICLVEGAGGALSPTPWSGAQADFYREWDFPVVLVGNGRLGGITETMSTLESLQMRGFRVCAICFIAEDSVNSEYFKKQTEIPVIALDYKEDDKEFLTENASNFNELNKILIQFHEKELSKGRQQLEKSLKNVWWPFTQHATEKDIAYIHGAHGDSWELQNANTMKTVTSFDASGSWWTQSLGHGPIEVVKAASYAMGRYGHVIFPKMMHEPAAKLIHKLVEGPGSGWAQRVFFSDNGSSAVEVSIKAALRLWGARNRIPYNKLADENLIVWGLLDSYHGDTLGAQSATSPNLFKEGEPWYKPRGIWCPYPKVTQKEGVFHIELPEGFSTQGFSRGELAFATQEELFSENRYYGFSQLRETYRNYLKGFLKNCSHVNIGALIIEPIIMGSNGMIFVDPLFQREMCLIAKEHGIPVIFDEVFTGIWRLGVLSARSLVGVDPDIACYAKNLTGGVVPMAVTLTSEETFSAYKGNSKAEALLHGHSYTAVPAGCAASLQALEEYEKNPRYQGEHNEYGEFWSQSVVREISYMKGVSSAFSLGMLLSIELETSDGGYSSQASARFLEELRKQGITARPLGPVVYFLANAYHSPDKLKSYLNKIVKALVLLDC